MLHLRPPTGEKSPTGTLSSPPRPPRRPSEGACFLFSVPHLFTCLWRKAGEEPVEFLNHRLRQFLAIRLLQQSVSCTFDWNQFRGRRNQLDRTRQFFNRAERITRTTDEQDGSAQTGEMRGPQLRRPSRRMQRIRQQKQAFHRRRLRGRQHTRPTSPVGHTAKKSSSRKLLLHKLDGPLQPGLIMLGVGGGRRAVRTPLAKRQV